MINIWGNDTDQNRVNNFLYGPYLNDGTVPIININQAKVIENNPCRKANIKIIADRFLEPGLWREDVGIKNQLNIAICAKKAGAKRSCFTRETGLCESKCNRVNIKK